MTTAQTGISGSTLPAPPHEASDSPQENPRRFVLIDLTVLEDYDLSPQALALYAHLKKFADYDTGRCWPKKETLAERLGMTQGRSADRYITELCEAGLIQDVRPRFCNPDDKRDWVIDEPDEAHTTQTSNLYVVNMNPVSPQVKPGCAPTQGEGNAQRTGGARQNADEQEPPINNQQPTTNTKTSLEPTSAEMTSVGAAAPADEFSARLIERKRRAGEKTPKAMPLHPEWQPNNANRAAAKKLGVDLDLAVEQFRKTMSSTGQNRRCWGSAFTKFLKAMAEQETAQFGISTEELIGTSIKRALQGSPTSAQPSTETAQTAGSSSKPDARDNHDDPAAATTNNRRSSDIDGPFTFKSAIWTLEEDGYCSASVRDRARELFNAGRDVATIIRLVKHEFVPEPEPLTA